MHFKKAVTQLIGFGHIFKPKKVGALPQTFTISKAGNTRWSNDLNRLCGAVDLKFTISDSIIEIKKFPYKDLVSEKNALEFTPKPTTDAETREYSVTENIISKSDPENNLVILAFQSVPSSTAHRNVQ
jgi:hypothetical protein